MKRIAIALILMFCSISLAQNPKPKPIHAAQAIKLGESALRAKYGDDGVANHEPYKAQRSQGQWHIRGATCNPICGESFEAVLDSYGNVIATYHGLL